MKRYTFVGFMSSQGQVHFLRKSPSPLLLFTFNIIIKINLLKKVFCLYRTYLVHRTAQSEILHPLADLFIPIPTRFLCMVLARHAL